MWKNIVFSNDIFLLYVPFAIDKPHPRCTFVHLRVVTASENTSRLRLGLSILNCFFNPSKKDCKKIMRFFYSPFLLYYIPAVVQRTIALAKIQTAFECTGYVCFGIVYGINKRITLCKI